VRDLTMNLTRNRVGENAHEVKKIVVWSKREKTSGYSPVKGKKHFTWASGETKKKALKRERKRGGGGVS